MPTRRRCGSGAARRSCGREGFRGSRRCSRRPGRELAVVVIVIDFTRETRPPGGMPGGVDFAVAAVHAAVDAALAGFVDAVFESEGVVVVGIRVVAGDVEGESVAYTFAYAQIWIDIAE